VEDNLSANPLREVSIMARQLAALETSKSIIL
jgi:hypothetical protein